MTAGLEWEVLIDHYDSGMTVNMDCIRMGSAGLEWEVSNYNGKCQINHYDSGMTAGLEWEVLINHYGSGMTICIRNGTSLLLTWLSVSTQSQCLHLLVVDLSHLSKFALVFTVSLTAFTRNLRTFTGKLYIMLFQIIQLLSIDRRSKNLPPLHASLHGDVIHIQFE